MDRNRTQSLARRLPDLPRWVEIRALLQWGRCEIFGLEEAYALAFALRDPATGLVGVVGAPSVDAIREAAEKSPSREPVIAPPEQKEIVSRALPGWQFFPEDGQPANIRLEPAVPTNTRSVVRSSVNAGTCRIGPPPPSGPSRKPKKCVPNAPAAMQMERHVAKVLQEDLRNGESTPGKPFAYFDKGSMATIGRSRAVAQVGKFELSGFSAWVAWLFIHLMFLVGFHNKLFVFLDWLYAYASFNRGARLIIRSDVDDIRSGTKNPRPNQSPLIRGD